MATANTDIATKFLIDDVSGARIPASRLRGILERMSAGTPLTPLQKQFLTEKGYHSQLKLALGKIELDEFYLRATHERQARAVEREAEAKREAAEKARKEEISRIRNAAIWADQKRKVERRSKIRELPDRFGLPYIQRHDLSRVNRILRSVVGGTPIGKNDLLWLARGEGEYWTDELRNAHHKIIAEDLQKKWKQTADIWCAVNACCHWRKAECPSAGLAIVEAALDKAVKAKTRAALLTTGGGALRDLGRLPEADTFGQEAHLLDTKDFRPCTLLGAVHIQMRAYAVGAAWYEKAEARGARPRAIDSEIASILRAAPQEERNFIKTALKAYDDKRYCRL